MGNAKVSGEVWYLNPCTHPFFLLGYPEQQRCAKKLIYSGKRITILLTIEQAPDDFTQTPAQEAGL